MARPLSVTITRKTLLNDTVIELALLSPIALEYKAGQFIQLRMAGEWRAYSVASMPDAFTTIIVVQLIEGGRASKEFIECAEGDQLTMLPPDGWFTFTPGQATCFVGTSTGIIPLYAMIATALEAGETKQLQLVFGARSQKNLFYTKELSALAKRYSNFKVIYALSKPVNKWDGYEGRATAYLRQNFSSIKNNVFYVSAWHETVESLEALLLRLGVQREKLFSEYYD